MGLSLSDVQEIRALYEDGARETVGPWLGERLAGVREDLEHQIEQLEVLRERIETFIALHADDLQQSALDKVASQRLGIPRRAFDPGGCDGGTDLSDRRGRG